MNNTRVYFLDKDRKLSWQFADIITIQNREYGLQTHESGTFTVYDVLSGQRIGTFEHMIDFINRINEPKFNDVLNSKKYNKECAELEQAIFYNMSTKNIIEENQKKITNLWSGIISMLPTQPRSFDTSDDPGFWTNGEEILCPSEAVMEMVYEFLNDIFREFGNYTLITGWYDPEEDRENGEQDDCTGFNYVRLE